MRLAVVGHVEWVEFVRVERVPRAGEIVHALEVWEQAGGGGAVAAVQLAALAGSADLYTALGSDEVAERSLAELEGRGVRVHAARRDGPQRRAVTFVDRAGERTITVIGERLVPHGTDPLRWDNLAGADGVYLTGGDPEAIRAARAARVLVATPRTMATLREAHVGLDALVGSGRDASEVYREGDLDPPPRLVVTTAGAEGGVAEPGGPFPAAAPPGAVVDTYGAGDCFAAGLTYALARGLTQPEALAFAARCGAAALTGRGVHAAALAL